MTYIEPDTLSPAQMLNLKSNLVASDDDLRRAITMDELLVGVKEDIHNIFQGTTV